MAASWTTDFLAKAKPSLPVTYAALSASTLRNPYAPARTHRRLLAAPFLAEAKSALPKAYALKSARLRSPNWLIFNTLKTVAYPRAL